MESINITNYDTINSVVKIETSLIDVLQSHCIRLATSDKVSYFSVTKFQNGTALITAYCDATIANEIGSEYSIFFKSKKS